MSIHGLPASTPKTGPAHFDILNVIRPNILSLHPYRCARDDYSTGILLDANENALGNALHADPAAAQLELNRYPDPRQPEIKARLAELRGLPGTEYLFLGVGSDEAIDLLMRVCVAPGTERVLVTPPTYGMYGVCAQINDVGVVKVPLELSGDKGEGGADGRFSVRVDEVKAAVKADPTVKLIILCSPGNPTGTLIPISVVRELLDFEDFKGIVVIDEAYIDFAEEGTSAVALVKDYANVCVLQTLSKSFGLAGIRLGVAIAQPALIQVLNNTKAPYNISSPASQLALAALQPAAVAAMHATVATLNASRTALLASFAGLAPLGVGRAIGGNDANFIVVPILHKGAGAAGRPDSQRAQAIYTALAEEHAVVVRYRGNEPGCAGCLRITVGSAEENRVLLERFADMLERL